MEYVDEVMQVAKLAGARNVKHVGHLDINVHCGQWMHADVARDEYVIDVHNDDMDNVLSMVYAYVVSNGYDEVSVVRHDGWVKAVLKKSV